jgi:hypothetical protein
MQRFIPRELIGPAPLGAGFLAAGDAARSAPVGQLPGDEQRRRVGLDRVPMLRGWIAQVKRM